MQVEAKLLFQHFTIILVWIYGVSGAGLHGPCENDQECGTIDTFCHKNVCVCKENFAVLYDSCVALAQPRQSCTHKNECHKALGVRSICTKKKQCACKPFHHLHMGQCVKNRDLSLQCDHDFQCYCGAGCEDKIACLHHSCTCKPEYTSFGARRCLIPQNEIIPQTTIKMPDSNVSEVVDEKSISSTTIVVESINSSVLESTTIPVGNTQDEEVPSVIVESTFKNAELMSSSVVNYPGSAIVCLLILRLVNIMF